MQALGFPAFAELQVCDLMEVLRLGLWALGAGYFSAGVLRLVGWR